MPNSERLREFLCVTDEGSISSAARVMGIPRPTLSRRLGELEGELGVRLMHRQTRRLVLTPAGEELQRRARRVVAELDAVWDSVRRLDGQPRGPLRVSIPENHETYTRLFVDYAQAHPEVRLEISVDARHVDLVAEGIDVGIRAGAVRDPSLVARRLWTTRSVVVAAPEYLSLRGMPTEAAHLSEHDCITGHSENQARERPWPLVGGGEVSVRCRFAASSIRTRLEAAKRGIGLALVPLPLVEDELASGELRMVLDGVVGRSTPISLVFVDREFLPQRVRAFVDMAVVYLGEKSEISGAASAG